MRRMRRKSSRAPGNNPMGKSRGDTLRLQLDLYSTKTARRSLADANQSSWAVVPRPMCDIHSARSHLGSRKKLPSTEKATEPQPLRRGMSRPWAQQCKTYVAPRLYVLQSGKDNLIEKCSRTGRPKPRERNSLKQTPRQITPWRDARLSQNGSGTCFFFPTFCKNCNQNHRFSTLSLMKKVSEFRDTKKST